jgi:hypothetical protein
VVDLINDVFKPVYKRVAEKKTDLIWTQSKYYLITIYNRILSGETDAKSHNIKSRVAF